MNLALRILGVAIFVSAVAGASFGAFQAFDRDPGFRSVELTAPSDTPVTVVSGGSSSVTIGVENTGDVNGTLNFRSATDGFTFKARNAPLTVNAGQTSRAAGVLTASGASVGTTDLTIQAVDANSGDTVSQVSFKVKVLEGGIGEVTLDPTLPAAIPGGNVTLQASADNPVATQQTYNFSATGASATVEPASTDVPANGTGRTTVTAQVPAGASGSVSITLTVTADGSSQEATAEVPVLGAGEIAVGAVEDSYVVRPGNRFTVPVLVVSNLDEPRDISASGADVVATNFTQVEPQDAAGGFATLKVPSTASGTVSRTISISVGDQTREVSVQIDTDPSGEVASVGKQAQVDYVGRLIDGKVFDTSVRDVAHGPFEKSSSFRLRSGLAPIPVRISENPQRMIAGFVDAVNGMSVGESKSIVLSPSEAYGPVRTHENLSATSEIDRTNEVPRNLDQIPKQRVPPSFDIENATEGDILTFETTAGDEKVVFEFKLVRKGERTVDLQRMAEVGDTTTFYGPWPNATEVTAVNETRIEYTTTPPEDIGNFTWDAQPDSHQASWENATTVQSVNETTIVLHHQPEEGITYEAQSGQGRFAQSKTYRVEGVNSTHVHVSTPNDHPLAGKTLAFDITVRDVEEPRQQQPTIRRGGGR